MSVLVGKKAPDFKANAVVGGKIESGFTLSQFIGKKYVILFFYPKDFTFVCPTEILAFQAADLIPNLRSQMLRSLGNVRAEHLLDPAFLNLEKTEKRKPDAGKTSGSGKRE